jgi:hypothetical protein
MPQENVEVVGEPVRRLWAALSKRDWAAFSAELDPEMEYTPVEEQVVSDRRAGTGSETRRLRYGGLRPDTLRGGPGRDSCNGGFGADAKRSC